MHPVSRLLLIAAAGYFGMASTVSAQEPAQNDWRVTLGGGVMLAPDYEGSDDYEFKPIPDIEINYRDSVILKNNSLSYNALRAVDPASSWRAGPRARYAFGRDQDDNAALRGLGDVDGSVELGGFVGYGAGPWSGELSVLQDVGDGHDGLVAELSGGYGFRFTPRLGARLSASMTYADDSYMQSFFGVTPAQALRSGYAAEDARRRPERRRYRARPDLRADRELGARRLRRLQAPARRCCRQPDRRRPGLGQPGPHRPDAALFVLELRIPG